MPIGLQLSLPGELSGKKEWWEVWAGVCLEATKWTQTWPGFVQEMCSVNVASVIVTKLPKILVIFMIIADIQGAS